MRRIYGIQDLKAQELLGTLLQIFRHDAAAIRMFTDACEHKESLVAKHPADFALVCLGHITDDNTIVPENRTVITGEALIAAIAEPQPGALKIS